VIAGHGPWDHPARGLLHVASWIYGLGVLGRLGLYRTGLLRRERLSTRIVSVGNLTAGGTGKTPFVILLADEMKNRGLRAAVIVRGYKARREGKTDVVSDGRTIRLGYPEAGDEALLLARKLPGVPVVMAADRVAGCQVAVREFGAEVILLDDGFQHLQVERDLDVVLLENENPFGYGYLLPRGLLREPVGALERADLLVITSAGDSGAPPEIPHVLRHTRAVPVLHAMFTPAGWTDTKTGRTIAEEDIRREEIIAFSGIANPSAFERTLRSLGIFPRHHCVFPDHHPYVPSDLTEIADRMQEVGGRIALTTEKDAVRLESMVPPFPVVALGVKLVLTSGESALKRCLDALFP
jgi:tetraacyldisaccharide 4'-kinase